MSDSPTRIPSQYAQLRAGSRAQRVAARLARTPSAGAALRWGVRAMLVAGVWGLVARVVQRGPEALRALPLMRWLAAVAAIALAWGVVAAASVSVLRALRRRGFPF